MKELPSTYFKNQMAATFVHEPEGVELRHSIGIKNVLWSTDFPHPCCNWPNAGAKIDELFVLSDGEPTTGQVTDTDEILRLVKEANKYLKVRINTVFSGTGKGAGFLRQLAEQNDGVFVQR